MTKGNIVNSQPVVLGVNSSSPGTLSHASGIVTGELRRYFANATGSTFFPLVQVQVCEMSLSISRSHLVPMSI